MIYLLTIHDREKRMAKIDSPEKLQTKFWQSFLFFTRHKTILYANDIFKLLNNIPLPDRVNILFSPSNEKTHKIPNVLINNNFKDLVATFSGTNEDVFVICSNRTITEIFAKDADFIIDYTTEEMGHTSHIIFDSINFADYTLLKTREFGDFVVRYFVREKTNFIGY